MRWRGAVEAYIDNNLAGDLSLARLSQVACLSPFHFHRQFQVVYGMTLAAFIRRCRFKRAAALLAFRECGQETIARLAGYQSSEAFSRAFKRCVGQSPLQFRQLTDWPAWHRYLCAWWKPYEVMPSEVTQEKITPSKKRSKEESALVNVPPEVEIVSLPALPVAVLSHRGDPALLGRSLQRFIQWRKDRGLHPSVSRTFNRVYGDPRSVAPAAFRLDLCVEFSGQDAAPLERSFLAAGRYARVTHRGSDVTMAAKIDYLYRQWLPEQPWRAVEAPLLLERRRLFPDVAEHEAVTDIYLPLR